MLSSTSAGGHWLKLPCWPFSSFPFPSHHCSLCPFYSSSWFLFFIFPVSSSWISSLPPLLLTAFTPSSSSCWSNPPMYIHKDGQTISVELDFLSLSFTVFYVNLVSSSQFFPPSPTPSSFPLLFYLFLWSVSLFLSLSPLHLLSPAEKNRGVFWRQARANTDIQPAPLTALLPLAAVHN